METLLISSAILAAFLLLLRFVAPPLKPKFRIEERISTQALLNRIAFLSRACVSTEIGYGVSTRSVKRALKKNIKILNEGGAEDDASVIPSDTAKILSAAYERLNVGSRLCLKQGHIGKVPRLFLFCDTVVKNTRGCVPPDLLRKAVEAFTPLNETEKAEFFDVLVFCLSGLVCTALEDHNKRRRDYVSGVADAKVGRIDLDRLRNTDYICGQCAVAEQEYAQGLYTLADNNGIDIAAAVRSGSIHSAETAEILTSAISAMKYALDKKARPRALAHKVSKQAERALQICAIIFSVTTVTVSAIFSDRIFIVPFVISTIVIYTAYVKLLRIFGITVGILPPISDRFIAAAQGVLIVFNALFFDPLLFVFAVSTVICETWVCVYFAGENSSLAPLKSIPIIFGAAVAVPNRIVRFGRRNIAVIAQLVFSATVITVNALFASAPIIYLVGVLSALEPLYGRVWRLLLKAKTKWRVKRHSRKKSRQSLVTIPRREYSNMLVGRNDKGKIAITRRGVGHELNYTLTSDVGALALSKSDAIALSHKTVYRAKTNALEVSAEVVAPPTHDCCALRFSVINRTDRLLYVDMAVTCASEISEELVGLYIEGEQPDVSDSKVLRVEKTEKIDAFGKASFLSALVFGRMAEEEMDVIASDGYFDAVEAAAICCYCAERGKFQSDGVTANSRLRKNILCGGNVFAEVTDSGVTCGSFPHAHIILHDLSCESDGNNEWSPTLFPCGFNNKVLHYNGFSRFTGMYNGVKCFLDIFAVHEKDALSYKLKLKNLSDGDRNIDVSLECGALGANSKTMVSYGSSHATVTVKDGDGFTITSTERIEKPTSSVRTENPVTPTVRSKLALKGGEEKDIGFLLSRERMAIDLGLVGKYFDETVDYFNAVPIRPLTTDKHLDYAYNRSMYRIMCEFNSDEVANDAFTSLALCRAFKFFDADAVEKRILEICRKSFDMLSPPRCLALPLAVDDLIRFVGSERVLTESVIECISAAVELTYGFLCNRNEREENAIAAFCYCVDRFRDYFSAEQRLRFRSIGRCGGASTLTMLIGLCGDESAYRAARSYDCGDFDSGYDAIGGLADSALDFEKEVLDASFFFSIATEMLFGIDRRGDNIMLSPAVALGTPHLEFSLCDGKHRTHIVVADNSTGDGSWCIKMGNVVYATNVVTIADHTLPIILFRREINR